MNKLQLLLPIDDAVLASEPEVWRPIHYLGSKLRMVDPIRTAIDRIDPGKGPVCDLFAGSGTVSAALAKSREVTAVDIQEYSRVLCSAVLRPTALSEMAASEFINGALGSNHQRLVDVFSPLIEYEEECLRLSREGDVVPLCELIENASVVAFNTRSSVHVSDQLRKAHASTLRRLEAIGQTKGRETLTARHFGGLYFSYLQSIQLDAFLTAAQKHEGDTRDRLLAAVISTASEVVNTVGKHFAQPIRPRSKDGSPKLHLVRKILRDRAEQVVGVMSDWLRRYAEIPKTQRRHQAIRGDFEYVLRHLDRNVSVVYADPPYTRDHYSRFYHVLETMSLWDEPVISTTRIHSDGLQLSRGMYRSDRYQSPFCINSEAPDAFAKMFAAVKDLAVPLVLSYSPFATHSQARPRVMTMDQLVSLASTFFSQVDVDSVGRFSHSKLNTVRLNKDLSYDAEMIITCS